MRPLNQRWFAIRQDLAPSRRVVLTLLSFLLPLGVWCFVSYVPWIWHPAVKLQVSADREGVTTVFTAGDRVSKGFFPEFVDAVRQENAKVLADREAGVKARGAERTMRRRNVKLLRQIAPVAVAEGWLAEDQGEDDAAIYAIWGDLAEGRKKAGVLSDENMQIIRDNWAVMAAVSPTYNAENVPGQPLLKLVPQGRLSNPEYLPAPDEVLTTGIRDFTARPPAGKPWMYQRLLQSVKIVFMGFFFAAVIGVPIGVLGGTYDVCSKVSEPFIDFFRYMPAPTFSTLLVAILAADDAPKIALIFVGTFFQLVLVVANTTRQLDASLLEAAQTLGARGARLLFRVVVPGILPRLYNDLRILLGWAWTWLVIAELIGVKSGLTEFIETQGRFRNFDRVFPVIITIGLLGFFTDQVLQLFARWLFPWEYRAGSGWIATIRTALSRKRQPVVDATPVTQEAADVSVA